MNQGEEICEIFRRRARARDITVQQIVKKLGRKDTTAYGLYQFWIGKSMPPIHKLSAYLETVGLRLLLEADGNVYTLQFKDKIPPKREGERLLMGARINPGGDFKDLTPEQIGALNAQIAFFRSENKRPKKYIKPAEERRARKVA